MVGRKRHFKEFVGVDTKNGWKTEGGGRLGVAMPPYTSGHSDGVVPYPREHFENSRVGGGSIGVGGGYVVGNNASVE